MHESVAIAMSVLISFLLNYIGIGIVFLFVLIILRTATKNNKNYHFVLLIIGTETVLLFFLLPSHRHVKKET
jgi:hypothetical protein